jgi:hypothetical protein
VEELRELRPHRAGVAGKLDESLRRMENQIDLLILRNRLFLASRLSVIRLANP